MTSNILGRIACCRIAQVWIRSYVRSVRQIAGIVRVLPSSDWRQGVGALEALRNKGLAKSPMATQLSTPTAP